MLKTLSIGWVIALIGVLSFYYWNIKVEWTSPLAVIMMAMFVIAIPVWFVITQIDVKKCMGY